MSDPVIRQTRVADYLAANRPTGGYKPVAVKPSTSQTAVDLAQIRATIAADVQASAAAEAAFKSGPAPRLDDVAAMLPQEAQARLAQLSLFKAHGGLGRIGANAVNGDQATTSVETYMEWLQARAGQQTSGGLVGDPPPLFDITA